MPEITAYFHTVFLGFYGNTIGYGVISVNFDYSFVKPAPEELRNQENAQDAQKSLGAQVITAVSLLNLFIREIDDPDIRIKVSQLKALAERGVITYIPKRLQRIQKDLTRSGKNKLSPTDALDEIIDMAKKYSPYFVAQETLMNEQETNAEIILSESFN